MASFLLSPTRTLLQLGLRGTSPQLASRGGANRHASLLVRSLFTASETRCTYQVGRAASIAPSCARTWSLSNGNRRYATSRQQIITRFEDLPETYEDKRGLPFRETELDAKEVKKIFGRTVKVNAANKLLQILHGRRVAGTLDDPAYTANTVSFTEEQIEKSLKYLRESVEVNEVLNAGLRAEDELAQLELDVESQLEDSARADPKWTNAATSAAESEGKEPKATPEKSVYGEGVFDTIRARNIAKREEQERIEAEERAARGEEESQQSGPLAKVWNQPRELSPQMQQYLQDGMLSHDEAPPDLSTSERLLPSAAFTALVVGMLTAFAAFYVPPETRDRLFPEVSAGWATVGTMIALNTTVLVLWRIPRLWRFLNKNFVFSHGLPTARSVLLASMSHQAFFVHFLPNMIGLAIFGPLLHDDVGRANFIALYVASSMLGFLVSMWLWAFRGVLGVASMGASGGVYGIIGSYFWLHRFDNFKVFGLPPDPMNGPSGLAFLGAIMGLQVWALTKGGKPTIDFMSHVAGMFVGVAGVAMVQKRQQKLAAAPARVDGIIKPSEDVATSVKNDTDEQKSSSDLVQNVLVVKNKPT